VRLFVCPDSQDLMHPVPHTGVPGDRHSYRDPFSPLLHFYTYCYWGGTRRFRDPRLSASLVPVAGRNSLVSAGIACGAFAPSSGANEELGW